MKEFARERLVDHNNRLRVRTIKIMESSSFKHGNLQSLEIARGDIHVICHYLLSGLLSLTQRDAGEQCTFIRQAQTNGGVLYAGDLFHRGKALIEQLSVGCRIVVPNVVERCFRCHHATCIEARRHRLKVDQHADEQPGSSQQDYA